MSAWSKDLRIACRQLWRQPGSSLLLITILALGIGCNGAMFGVLRPLLLQSLPYPDPEQLVHIWETDLHNGETTGGASFPDLADWRAEARSFSGMAPMSRSSVSLRQAGGEPQRVSSIDAGHDLLALLGVQPALGRVFAANDDQVGAAPVVLLGQELWRDRFAANPAIVGQMIEIEGSRHQVIGVLPPATGWALRADVWRPITPVQARWLNERGTHSFGVLARLKPGVSVGAAEREMQALMSELERRYPDDNTGRNARVIGMHAHQVRNIEQPLWLLGATMLTLLLLTCCNASALLLARTSARELELAIRSSLGAGKLDLIRQIGVECLLLCLLGGLLAIGLAWSLLQIAAVMNPLPGLDASVWRLDPAVLVFALLTCLACGLCAGSLPAMLSTRIAPAGALRASRGLVGFGGEGARRWLVVGQIALALVLLLGSSVLLRSYAHLTAMDLGVRSTGVASTTVSLPEARFPMPPLDQYPNWPAVVNFHNALLERVAAIPGVSSAGLAQNSPLESAWTTRVQIEDRPAQPGEEPDEWQLQAISPGLLHTLAIPLLAGRDLTNADRPGAPMVVLINQAAAQRYFPNADPVGKRISFWGKAREIVGVIGNMRSDGLAEPSAPALFPALAQTPFSTVAVVAHTEGDAAALLPALRAAIWSVQPDALPFAASTLDEHIALLTAPHRFALALASALAVLALVLALSGLVGLIAFDVQKRRAEMGIRLALGASGTQLVWAVLGKSSRLAALGMTLGAGLFLLSGSLLQQLVFDVPVRDFSTIAGTLGLFAVFTLLASLLPARSAMRAQPSEALRGT